MIFYRTLMAHFLKSGVRLFLSLRYSKRLTYSFARSQFAAAYSLHPHKAHAHINAPREESLYESYISPMGQSGHEIRIALLTDFK